MPGPRKEVRARNPSSIGKRGQREGTPETGLMISWCINTSPDFEMY
jgi:hypothetical protein